MKASDIKQGGAGLPGRVILHGVEGWGKTTFGAFAPSPVVLMSGGETGLETLIDAGQLPPVDHFPEIGDWHGLAEALELIEKGGKHKTVVLDTLNGFERLCHEHVCQKEYGGRWGKDGFTSYSQGFEASLPEWKKLLCRLDDLRRAGIGIVALCHSKVAPFRNPEGADYDRYQPDMHHKTWSLTHRWADIVLFANFYTAISNEGGKAKGQGGKERIMFAERSAAYDAKNRHGLPTEIEVQDSPESGWKSFIDALRNAPKKYAKPTTKKGN